MKKTILFIITTFGLSGLYFYFNASLFSDAYIAEFIFFTLATAAVLYAAYDIYHKTVNQRQLKGLVLFAICIALGIFGAYLDEYDHPANFTISDIPASDTLLGGLFIYFMLICLIALPSLFRKKAVISQ